MAEMLSRLGMSEYTNIFYAEGFDTWEAIMDIAETDLAFLAVSQTHRARLHQEIIRARTQHAATSRQRMNPPMYINLYPYAS
jgi:SAM domain (Sterile alpha motif)